MSLKLALYSIIHLTYMIFLFIASVFKRFRYLPEASWYHHYSFIKMYLVVETAIATYLLEQKQKWLGITPLFVTVTIDSLLIKTNLLKVKGNYWASVFSIRLATYLLSIFYKKWIKQ